ncbi:MAG: crotonase/enoyl-CoA hydratase family protein [Rhodocyclaceae bacterium]|nr:crotonase/enoyl-CoA hydratase family protein [Rhodocyclaceae bacterium]MCA3026392.1 crotonase/enoyl-CoA hydratase family protein [Rhodocyclaceae bacterium]MCA3032013.1 crotonase/enoyl-CoA hydratase family protein [Rhodocyclaceae bacterium]MCA3037714.1 crotonase/enoyl-CoA hydratase family protein [Rhodocyclaceae bacterium]MCA3046282.1 crotonase/enoyl-CoA hydratase family protein [Rhodocyclaceae bacterium]
MTLTKPTVPTFTTLTCSLVDYVARITLNRPDKANAMNAVMWQEIRQAMRWVDSTAEARVAIIDGAGANFCAGIDLGMMMSLGKQIEDPCDARTRENLRIVILDLQDTLTSIERCRKPVLAAIHGACIGGAIDLVSCCDMRYASNDAVFSIKEVDIGMTADVGTLQRLPKIISPAVVRELAYTAKSIDAVEAERVGLVNRVYASTEVLQKAVLEIAASIAAKSPLAIRGTKEMLNYARDHSVADGLNYIASWNAGLLMSADLQEAMMANMDKRSPEFRD